MSFSIESLLCLSAGVGQPAVFSSAAAADPTLRETLAKAFFPLGAYIFLAPILWLFFRRTWRDLDVEAHERQGRTLASGAYNYRPAVLFAITAIVLTMQEYYGGRGFYEDHIKPWFRDIELAQVHAPGGIGKYVNLRRYSDLYSYGWWAFTRVFGYVAFPMIAWKIIFRKDSILDMGLRLRGLLSHAWIYLLCLAVVIPTLLIVARSPDFGNYYPFYKLSSRSYTDLIAWELMYIAQFLALEIFFRGFWLSGLRDSLGSGAIFAMCVPYCMIHYGKPYLEAAGAVVAGVALGSLAMRTRSIYSGFLVHMTVALTMDLLALHHRNALPTAFY
jgi:membrane protease YdiL (CAAX protease family)